MKESFFVALGLFLLMFTSMEADVSAQENNSRIKAFLTGNTTLEGGIGTQILFSRDAGVLDMDQRLTPVSSLAAGKWMSPLWGIQMKFNGFRMNGFTVPQAGMPFDPVTDYVTVRPDGSYRHYLKYFSTSLGLKVSLLTLVKGYNENRVWDIIPAFDAGYVRMLSYKGSPAGNYISPGFSVTGKYRVNSKFDIQLEARTMLLPDKFDGRVTGKGCENNLALTLGVAYRLGKEQFRMKKKEIVDDHVLNVAPGLNQAVPDTVFIEQQVAADTVYVEVPVSKTPLPADPFIVASFLFSADGTSPKPQQELQCYAIADYLKRNPEHRIRLDAYSDEETGSESYNAMLATARARNVKSLLVSQYHIDESKLIENAIGIKSRPFDKRVLNRVVLATVLPAD